LERYNIWRDWNANGLYAPVESVFSLTNANESIEVENGKLLIGHATYLPYFGYSTHDGRRHVSKPTMIWADAYTKISLVD